jgi:hypothetical protein
MTRGLNCTVGAISRRLTYSRHVGEGGLLSRCAGC